MADFKDFYEDNKERYGQYLDSAERRTRHRRGGELQPPPVIVFCPVCHSAHTSDEDRSRHLFAAHAVQHVYLRVNGAVVRDLAWTTERIDELSLVMLGHGSATVHVKGPKLDTTFTAQREVNLKRHIPATLEGHLRIVVTPEGGKHSEFSIYCRSLPEFRCSDLDNVVLELQSEFARSHTMPNITAWRKSAGKLGDLEHRYLNGFYAYTLAFYLEEQKKPEEAKAHFEDAFGYLLPFRTPLADSAQCVLGLRMNCFGVLLRAPEKSSVGAAGKFFNEPYPTAWPVPSDYRPGNPFETYADVFTVRLVNAVASYYAGDDVELGQSISALEFHPAAEEKNHEDKVALLKARAARSAGDTACARRAYDALRYHPSFGTEAEAYLNGTN